MEKEDARYQKLEQLHDRRKQVVRLHVRGTGVMAIVTLTGLNPEIATLLQAAAWDAVQEYVRQ